jgi:polar amino acid transport system substrate-binding protein
MSAMTWRYLLAMTLALPLAAGAAGPVLLAGEDDWAPYSAAESASSPQDVPPKGFSVTLIRAALATQGLTPQFVTVPFARCMRMAKAAQVAGCFNATITDDNRDDYLWHQPPMFEEELSIFGRADERGPELRLSDLRGKRVAITNGYTYPTEFMRDPRIQRFTATSDTNLLRMLLTGRVDYILLNRTPGWMRIDASPEFRGKVVRRGIVSADAFWIAFAKTHPDGPALAQAFGRGLAQMRRDGSYARLLDDFRRQVGYR